MNNYKIIKYCDFKIEDSYDTTDGIIVAVEGLKKENYKYFPFYLKSKPYHLFALSDCSDLRNFNKPEDLIFNKRLSHYFGICPQTKNLNFDKENITDGFLRLIKHWFKYNDLDFDEDIKVKLFNFNNFNNLNNFEEIEL